MSLPLRLTDQFCFALYSTSHALTRVYKPLLDQLGLTYPQYLVLLALWDEDGLTVGGIGERLMLDSSTLTPLLKRLEGAGLLRRDRNPTNERQVIVRLLEKGRAMRERAAGLPFAILCATGQSSERLGALKIDIAQVRDALVAASSSPEAPERDVV
jgi:DNA-binding MarR family transcriptional regulator